ncbi:MAG: CidA/LrgA family protein [Pseudolabrys sp.]|nr:CidA/LrgA family protein [Pseudolabrys sp.]
MLAALAALLACQLAGEAMVRAAGLPVPGPVAGMALLFLLMVARAPLPKALGDTADGMLKHLSLLFVPAGVGVVQNLNTLGDEGLRLVLVVVLATVIALAATALTFEYLARFMHVDENAADHDGRGTP